MKTFHRLIATIAVVTLSYPAALIADTVIELHSNNDTMTFMSNGKKARINTRGNNDYMIVDFASKAIYAIRPDDRQIVNLNESVPALSNNEPPEVKIELIPTGKGPDVAGYATKSYQFKANGENCGTVDASKDALDGTSIDSMLEVMNEMAENARKALGGLAAAIPPCQQANMSLGSQVSKIGAPLQIIDAQGQAQRHVDRITKNVNVDASNYVLPVDYQSVNVADKLEKAQKMNSSMDKLQKHAPEMQEMMRQMQETGRLPPEAAEKMRHFEEMMQQQQQR